MFQSHMYFPRNGVVVLQNLVLGQFFVFRAALPKTRQSQQLCFWVSPLVEVCI